MIAQQTAAAPSPGDVQAFHVSRIGRYAACRIIAVHTEKRLVALDD